MSSTFLCCLQCLVGVLRSLGIWTSKQRGSGPVFPDFSVPELKVHADGVNADGTDLEVKDDTKPMTQADEFEKAKALKVTMESAVAKVLPFLGVARHGHVLQDAKPIFCLVTAYETVSAIENKNN